MIKTGSFYITSILIAFGPIRMSETHSDHAEYLFSEIGLHI